MKIIHSILLGLFPLLSFGQNLRYVPAQPVIEDAVSNGLFICKQSFQISDKETGDLYGLNGKEEFGSQYALGIKTANGFLAYNPFVHPWEYDAKFNKYRDGYIPVIFQSSYAEQSPKARFDSLEYEKEQEAICDSVLYQFTSRTFGGKGFAIDNTDGEKDGWVVLVTCGKEQRFEENTSLNCIIYHETVTFKDKGATMETNLPGTNNEILGGIFVVPVYTDIGEVVFKLCGVLVPSEDKEWKLCCPFIGLQTEDTEPELSVAGGTANDESELTPAGKNQEDNNKKKRGRK